MVALPTPAPGDELQWVHRHLGHLTCDGRGAASTRLRGGQTAADAALAATQIRGYAGRRNEVLPLSRRGATMLSPYVRHGLIPLPELAAFADRSGAPQGDREKFVDELLWQEYARHLYARLGGALREPLRAEPGRGSWGHSDEPMPADMACLALVRDELETDGWLVNQTRMWAASQWVVRSGHDWRDGEDWFFRHLLDGSRAANRLGWQWTIGSGTGKPYGFSQWQVDKRAPNLCNGCEHRGRCPIRQWPDEEAVRWREAPSAMRRGTGLEGPSQPVVRAQPDGVWLTAESLGDADPALAAWPALDAWFVFDESLLATLRLSTKRLVFLAECLADLATRRTVHVLLGRPSLELSGRSLAATFAPVPGWQRIAAAVDPVAVHPWPWLVNPDDGVMTSFSAWANRARRRINRFGGA
jgi:deoxyribodipyrimidine photo-lyase